MRKLLLGFILFSTSFYAQVTTSSISGNIQVDNSPAKQVEITLTHLPTNYTYTSQTDNKGNYEITDIDAGGPYKLTISVDDIEYCKTYEDLVLGENEVKKIQILTK